MVGDVDRRGVAMEWRISTMQEAVRAPAGALATALFNQPMRPRNGVRTDAVGVGR